jgi:hypothetical protein
MWVVDYLDDLEADFLAIYRIDDPMVLSGPRFFKLAHRVGAYNGVITLLFQQEAERQPGATSQASGSDRVQVDSTSTALATALPGVFDFQTVEG